MLIFRTRPMLRAVLCGLAIGSVPRIGLPAEMALTEDYPAGAAASRAGLRKIEYTRTLHHIGCGDINGDGLTDLILAAHVESTVTPFLQGDQGEFTAGDLLPNPGFHPNGTLILSGSDGVPYVVLNAETANAQRIYRGGPSGQTEPAGDITVPAPHESVRVDWPGWGLTIAITSKEGNRVTFLRGFNPAQPVTARKLDVHAGGLMSDRLTGLTSADLEGQGLTSVLVTNGGSGEIIAFRPQGDDIHAKVLASFGQKDLIRAVLPIRFNNDERTDLFVLGEGMTDAVLLLNQGDGGFEQQRFPVTLYPEQRGVQSGIVTRDQDGTVLLWVGSDVGLTVLRWDADRRTPPLRLESLRGAGWMRFAQADLNQDKHADLIIGSSTGGVPPTVVYGPLATQVDAVLALVRGSLPGAADEKVQAPVATPEDAPQTGVSGGMLTKPTEPPRPDQFDASPQQPSSADKAQVGTSQEFPATVVLPLATPPAADKD